MRAGTTDRNLGSDWLRARFGRICRFKDSRAPPRTSIANSSIQVYLERSWYSSPVTFSRSSRLSDTHIALDPPLMKTLPVLFCKLVCANTRSAVWQPIGDVPPNSYPVNAVAFSALAARTFLVDTPMALATYNTPAWRKQNIGLNTRGLR